MSEGSPQVVWLRRFATVRMAGLFITAAALPWNNVLVSNGQILMLVGWFGEGLALGELGRRFRVAFSGPWSLAFIGYFLLHLAGVAWSSDLEWALDLCRILLPVLVFGLVLSTAPPLGERAINAVLRTGAWSVVLSTVACLLLAGDMLLVGDHRATSLFISHVRLGLLLALAISVFLVDRPLQRWLRWLHLAGAAWAFFFLVRTGSFSGIAALSSALFVLAWRAVQGLRPLVCWSLRTALTAVPVGAALLLASALYAPPPQPVDPRTLDMHSAGGEPYYHDLQAPLAENGHPVWLYVADEELERGWERRSRVGFRARDARGYALRGTLVRYMASRGLRKDSLGLLALTDEDVRRIEQGMTSIRTGREPLLITRLAQLRGELPRYRLTGDPNGHSLTMRLEHWRAGWWIARRHLIAGVGTGDTRPAFESAYRAIGSRLAPAWRNRAHNTYLTVLISFGIPGLLLALFCWTAPVVAYRAWRHPAFAPWAAILLVSFITEDTLETQTGATFYALYAALFVFGARWINAQVLPPIAARPPVPG